LVGAVDIAEIDQQELAGEVLGRHRLAVGVDEREPMIQRDVAFGRRGRQDRREEKGDRGHRRPEALLDHVVPPFAVARHPRPRYTIVEFL
jgi:hypothetical protein